MSTPSVHGRSEKKKLSNGKKIGLGAAAGAVVLAAVVAGSGGGESDTGEPVASSRSNAAPEIEERAGITAARAEKAGTMTAAKYADVADGMTKAEVFAVVGGEDGCSQSSGTDAGGAAGESWTCYADDGVANAGFTFAGGKLVSKTQVGLE
ncbi:hypothetical protein AB0M28_38075 [Streptomyces sp. NPDC051940]|uniref:hypothetical protein n=1 Tax=Streptomyces sp. NPDC051940 TaxID=3155675 RepID=UPI00342400AC